MPLLTPTPDLLIRSFTLDDLPELSALVKANRDHLRRWLPWADRVEHPSDEAMYVEMGIDKEARGDGFEGGIYRHGVLVGSVGMHYVVPETRATEIGYWLAGDQTGTGIMTAAVRAVVAYGFGALKLNRVEIRAAAANTKSRAVPERLGFRLEGMLRRAHAIRDEIHDLAIYGLLADEWAG